MPKSKKEIMEIFSKRWEDKELRKHEAAKKDGTYKIDSSAGGNVARSLNYYPSKATEERSVSSNEGGVAVNGKPGGIITPVGKKNKESFVPTIDKSKIDKSK